MSTGNTIAVRTKQDREEEEHFKKLTASIQRQSANPFQRVADAFLSSTSHVYNTYLYSSGVMFLALSFWSFYPSFVRFRHRHLLRYRRSQLTLRRGFFATEHMPKWNKEYLQRIIVPPVPPVVNPLPRAAGNSAKQVTRSCEITIKPDGGEPLAPSATAPAAALYSSITELTTAPSRYAKFSSGEAKASATALSQELRRINIDFYSPKEHLFQTPVPQHLDNNDIHSRLQAAVKKSNAVVVLVETHEEVKSIPPSWEVWWVSEPEAKRRWFCKFWLVGLLCARAFEDLLDMPEMPDFVN